MSSFSVLNLTDEVLPLGVQVGLVGQAALHDIGAVAGAGFDQGHAATVRAIDQLHEGLRTLGAQGNLVEVDRRLSITCDCVITFSVGS